MVRVGNELRNWGELATFFHCFIVSANYWANNLQAMRASLGEFKGITIEKLKPQVALKFSHVPAKGRLGGVKLVSRFGKTPAGGKRDKLTKIVDHRAPW